MLFATTLKEPEFQRDLMSDWVLKYKNGKEALGVRRTHDVDVDHLMDVGNKNYIKFFRDFATNYVKKYNADGVIIDELLWFGDWNIDFDRIVQYESMQEMRIQNYNWLQGVAENNHANIMHKASWPKAQLHTDGLWGEIAFTDDVRIDSNVVSYDNLSYQEILDLMGSYGQSDLPYLWAAWYEEFDTESLGYVISTYLLGREGDSIFLQLHPKNGPPYSNGNLQGYSLENHISAVERNKKFIDLNLGKPLAKAKSDTLNGYELWSRNFKNGVVYSLPNQ